MSRCSNNYLTENILFDAGTIFTGPDIELWLDASDAGSLILDPDPVGDGFDRVTRWNDKLGNGNYVVPGGTAGDPNLIPGDRNSKDVVWFGPYQPDQSGTWDQGKWMQFKDAQDDDLTISNIRTVFLALKGYNHLLTAGGSYHFHRAGEEATSEIWHGTYSSANIRNGETYLNGVQVDGTTTPLPADYSLVSVVTTGDVEAGSLCSDRNQFRSGGQHIAEIIIFNRALNDAERELVEGDLKAKWGI